MKSGIKTTEFWLVAIVLVGLFALVLFGKGDYVQQMAAIVAPILAGFYALTRSKAKKVVKDKADPKLDTAIKDAVDKIQGK